MIRVAIVADSPLLRSEIADLLRETGQFEIVAAVGSLDDAQRASLQVDAVVLSDDDELSGSLQPRPAADPLTPREREVLHMLAAGLGNKEIAARLGISDHTAKFHVSQILSKLDAVSRAEAVSIAMRRGLVPL